MCSAYGSDGHSIQERTVLVGYSCDRHSHLQDSLWSQGSRVPPTQDGGSLKTDQTTQKGVKITSTAALRALEAAQLEDQNSSEDDYLTERPDESVLDAGTAQTSINNDPGGEATSFKESGSGIPSYLDELRSRLRHPGKHVETLQELERKIWENSTISMYGSWKTEEKKEMAPQEIYDDNEFIRYPGIPSDLVDVLPQRLSDDSFSKDPTNTSDEEITSICQSFPGLASYDLNAILMCRNVILRSFLNLKLLQQSNYCSGCFSIIVLDRNRHNVAKMVSIDNTDFTALVYEIEYILRDCASLVLSSDGSSDQLNIDRHFELLTTPMVECYCKNLLQRDPQALNLLDGVNLGVVSILRLLVHMLDLSVACYAGAHCSDFIPDNIDTCDTIDLLSPFEMYKEPPRGDAFLKLRRCNLQCLDQFHQGKPIWIFCPGLCSPSLPLYLSTTIDAFADIWGPLWKLTDQENHRKFSAYIVGNGSIVQWKHLKATSPPLQEELFCHWVSNEELEDDASEEFDGSGLISSTTHAPFDGTEMLLIGAPTSRLPSNFASLNITNKHPEGLGQRDLTVNSKCSLQISEFRSHLRELNRLCIVGATRPYHYNDSSQYQIQVGYSGVNASATRQYKRVPGQSLKHILLELWAMEPEIRDPKLLEDLHGVEISMCTYNAQRVSLLQILRFKCMRHLLRDFYWEDDRLQEEYFKTLEDPLRPTRLLELQFKQRFEHAVMLCLKMLSKTGVDRKDNLKVFLSSTCTPKPELATIAPKEHSWIGLLKDTITECAVAAFGDSCLEFTHEKGVSCGRLGRSALRSAMIPNSSMLPSLPLVKLREMSSVGSPKWAQGLDVSSFEVGKVFWLGERGSLCLKDHLGDGALLMEWHAPTMKTALRTVIGRQQAHREYTEVDHSEEGIARAVRPIPIFIVSDRIFGKEWRTVVEPGRRRHQR